MGELQEKRRRIRELMRYAVPDNRMEQAGDLLLLFQDDRMALTVLDEFYSSLPDARDNWIKELRLVAGKTGIFLFAAVTPLDAYLYLTSSEGIEFHGSLQEGYLDRDLLDFFDFSSAEQFSEAAADVEEFPLYEPLQTDIDTCPACQAATGELHELGCPVEICPWCGGQLIRCECRFTRLGQEELADEQDIVRFEALLNQKGRLAYSPEQRPSFADEGTGVELQ